MALSITKLASGTVELDFGTEKKYLGNLTNVNLSLYDPTSVYLTYTGGSLLISYTALVNLNGVAKPGTIAAALTLLATEVFNFGYVAAS